MWLAHLSNVDAALHGMSWESLVRRPKLATDMVLFPQIDVRAFQRGGLV
jgi:hypothetical protein